MREKVKNSMREKENAHKEKTENKIETGQNSRWG